ncbi:MAG: hypothetical protein QM666_03875 [Acinetobacter sp.]
MKIQQKGMSIVSLMIGILISVICATAMLIVFRNVTQATVQAQKSLKRDAKLQNAMAAVQIPIQSAGFGYRPIRTSSNVTEFTNGNYLALKTNLSLDGYASAVAYLWRYQEPSDDLTSGTVYCQGVAYAEKSDGTKQLLILKVKNTTNDVCDAYGSYDDTSASEDSNTALKSLTWEKKSVLSTLPDGVTLSFTIESVSCTPYGVGVVSAHPLVLITATTTEPVQKIEYPVCVSNIAQSTSS